MHGKRFRLAYYITSHGFGHAIRSCEVLHQLLLLEAELEIIVVSAVPEWLVSQNVGRRLPVRQLALDIGLIQYDSLHFDLGKTLDALRTLMADSKGIVEKEAAFLKQEQIGAVVSDIAFLPFVAAASVGIPSVGVSNFTWDWIYGIYEQFDSEWRDIIAWARECYSHCSLLLRLPMAGDCSACPRIEPIPLIARKAIRNREEVRQALGIAPGQKAYLLSFSTLILPEGAYRKLEQIEGVTFLYKSPLEFPMAHARSIDGSEVSYVEAVGAVDGVITKPGYGIVSDCLANGAPMIYTERGSFREYPILVEEIEKSLTSSFISREDFACGNWEGAIRHIGSVPLKAPKVRIDGGKIAAMNILRKLHSGGTQ
ncbi:MAG: hypothetical protein AB9866_12780 [Syntrophobacteraceae bacterium]